MRLLFAYGLAALVLVGAACNEGGGDPVASTSPSQEATSPSPEVTTSPGSPSPTGGDHPACEPAQQIADLDDEVTDTLSAELQQILARIASGEQPSDAEFEAFLAKVQAVVDEKVPQLVEAYDAFAEEVPQRLVKDVEIVRDFTVNFAEQLAQLAPDELDQIDKLFEGPEALEAAGSTFALDQFTQKECGITLAD